MPAKISYTFRPQNDLNNLNSPMMSNVCTFIFK